MASVALLWPWPEKPTLEETFANHRNITLAEVLCLLLASLANISHYVHGFFLWLTPRRYGQIADVVRITSGDHSLRGRLITYQRPTTPQTSLKPAAEVEVAGGEDGGGEHEADHDEVTGFDSHSGQIVEVHAVEAGD